ncbi:MAG TPA: hypothetical protein VMM60_10445, partial [Ilumatobacter sp.]|nr:hypothetical protein [Ilumatobacter sp.]
MNSSTPVTMVARADFHRQRLPLLLFALVVALVCGAVFATAAGARRTASVLDRLQARYPAPDVWIGVSDPRFAGDVERMNDLQAQLAALDGVERVAGGPNIFIASELDEPLTFSTGADDASYAAYLQDAVRFIAGRKPAIDGTREIALNEAAADALGLGPGDSLAAPTLSVETAVGLVEGRGDFVADGPELSFDVVGVYRDSLDVE